MTYSNPIIPRKKKKDFLGWHLLPIITITTLHLKIWSHAYVGIGFHSCKGWFGPQQYNVDYNCFGPM